MSAHELLGIALFVIPIGYLIHASLQQYNERQHLKRAVVSAKELASAIQEKIVMGQTQQAAETAAHLYHVLQETGASRIVGGSRAASGQ